MSLREKPTGIKSKYVKAPNGRIFLNNPSLAKLSDMSAVDIQGFTDPVPETVDQLDAMIAAALKEPAKTDENITPSDDNIFDFSKATKKQIAKKAKENFGFDIEDIDNKDVGDVRKEYEFLLATGTGNDDTGSGSN